MAIRKMAWYLTPFLKSAKRVCGIPEKPILMYSSY